MWDRTRAIRNDFSIQQVTKSADLETAIDCYERIARFHILSLHQLALPEKPYDRYDWYQEREQLDRTLLSLMQYYDDTKGRFSSPNEAEFRAYCVVFQAQDPTPDLEERVNAWEWDVKTHPRIRKALDLYNAACNILDPQGPLKPRAVHPVAQEDWSRFFALVQSNAISYLMACVAEIYFNLMRRAALNAIWRAFRPQSSKHDVADFTLPLMTTLLGFDDSDQTEHFCQQFGFVFKELDGADSYLDLNSVQGKTFPAAAQGMPQQTFSEKLVEHKRAGRTLPAVINGLTVVDAQTEGLVEEVVQDDSQMEDEDSLFVPANRVASNAQSSAPQSGNSNGVTSSPFASGRSPFENNPEPAKPASVFSNPGTTSGFSWQNVQGAGGQGEMKTPTNPFKVGQPPADTKSPNISATSPFGQPSKPSTSIFAPSTAAPATTSSVFGQQPHKLDSEGKPATTFSWTKPTSSTGYESNEGLTASVPGSSVPPVTASIFSDVKNKDTSSQSKQPSLTGFASPGQGYSGFSWPKSLPSPSSTTPSMSADVSPLGSVPPASAKSAVIGHSVFAPSPSLSSAPTPTPKSVVASAISKPSLSPSFDVDSQQSDKGSRSTEHLHVFSASDKGDVAQEKPSISGLHHNSTPSSAAFDASPPPFPSNTEPQSTNSPFQSFKPPSFGSQPNQPKRPSPLSQSITATEEGVSVGQWQSQGEKTIANGASPGTSSFSQQAQPSKASSKPSRSKDQILKDLSREVMLDVDTGFVRQYVEFHARQTILSVYDELSMESLAQLADSFRTEKLAYRFGRRWREICWKRRLVRQGREKRRRAKKNQSAREMEKKLAAETNAVDDFLKSVHGNKLRSSRLGKSTQRFGDTNGGTLAMKPDRFHAGQTQNSSENAREHRESNDGHVDASGRISKPQPAASLQSTPARAIFSKVQGSQSAVPSSTTRSSYFRLKALGINPNGAVVTTPLARKRGREDSEEAASPIARKSRPASVTEPVLMPDATVGTPKQPEQHDHRRSVSVLSQKEQEDEALFARARAARQALSESAAWYRSQNKHEDEERGKEVARLLSTSSMQRARETARLRASGGTMSFGGSIADPLGAPDIPAYRLRESRFVPREHYGKAVEKAKSLIGTQIFSPSRQGPRPNGTQASPLATARDRVHAERIAKAGARLSASQSHFQTFQSSTTVQRGPEATSYQFPAMQTQFSDGNNTPVADAMYHAMMEPGSSNTVHDKPNGMALPESFDNPFAVLGDSQILIDPSLQHWSGQNNGVVFGNDENEMESVEGTEDYEEDDEDGVEEYDEDEGFTQQEEFYDEEYDEEEDRESEESDEDGPAMGSYGQRGQLSGASTIKAGTGTQDDAFELSD